MFRILNWSRNAGVNLLRSSLREDGVQAGYTTTTPTGPAPQFLFWFNEVSGQYSPAPARSRRPTAQLAHYSEAREQQEGGQEFRGLGNRSYLAAVSYSALLAVAYNIVHDRALGRAVQDWLLHNSHLVFDPRSHCPVYNVKQKKTVHAQPLEVCSEAETEKRRTERIPTSDYSSAASREQSSSSESSVSRAEQQILRLMDSNPLQAVRQLRAGEVAGAVELASLAAAGCHTSQFYLGQAYQFGRTVEKDLLKAKQLYRQAARAGHSEAKHNLALLELSSREHSATHEPAGRVGEVKAERNSLSRGQAENLYRLGRELEADEESWLLVMEMYRLAARNGHSRAASRRDIIKAKLKLR